MVLWSLLTASMISLWFDRRGDGVSLIWSLLFLATCLLAWWSGSASGILLLALAVLWLLCLHYRENPKSVYAWFLVLMLAFALGAHLIPGVQYWSIWVDRVIKAGAAPYTLEFKFDKAAMGVLLLALVHARLRGRQWRPAMMATALTVIVALPVVVVAAWLLGYIRFQPALVSQWYMWLWAMIFVCIAEEMYFRGLLQAGLLRLFSFRGSGAAALLVAAVAFALAHAGGGVVYVLLAFISGCFYGFVYEKTRAIEACVLLHFGVNTMHFFFFSYPYLL